MRCVRAVQRIRTQAVVFAQEEARSLGHNYIGTEHILLGLLRDAEGIAARVLESRNVTSEEVRSRVMIIVGLGDMAATGQIPFTPRAKKVLELSLREALTLGHDYIGTEHILLGLAREPEGVSGADPLRSGIIAPGSRRKCPRSPRRRSGRSPVRRFFPTEVQPTAAGHDSFGIPVRHALGEVTLALGWVLFAVAFGLGLLGGWLIWG